MKKKRFYKGWFEEVFSALKNSVLKMVNVLFCAESTKWIRGGGTERQRGRTSPTIDYGILYQPGGKIMSTNHYCPPTPQIFRLSSIPECHVAANNSKLVGGGVETWHESSKESKLSIFAIQVKSQNAYIQILLLGFNTWPQQETKCHLALVYTISQGQIRKVSAVCGVGLV